MATLRKRLLLSLLAITSMSSAIAEDESFVMRIRLTDGSVDEYIVADRPTVSLREGKVYVVSASVSAEYSNSDIDEYTFSNATESAIKDVETDSPAQLSVKYVDGNTVEVRGVKSNKPIHVFSIDGKMQESRVDRLEDGATVSLVNLAAGTYIINIGGEKSVKVIKK